MNEFALVDFADGWTVGRFPALDALPGIAHLVTTRRALDVDLIASDRPAAAKALADALGLRNVAFLQQVHGDEVMEVRGTGFQPVPVGSVPRPASVGTGWKPVPRADGLITDEPGLGLMVVGADCALLLAADREGRAVGAAHASWRGTVKRIAFGLVRRMAERYRLEPSHLVACIGPSVGPERYEVGPDVVEAALAGIGPSARQFLHEREGKTFLDLWAANRAQLLDAGLREENVHVAGVCTIARNDLFPSYRAEGPSAGRFAAVIARR